MKKSKIFKLIISSSIGMIGMGLVILIPVLMLLDFFGANITDGYVENNSQYADMYKAVVRKNIMNGNGYVSLDRILYFYLENDNLTFEQIYTDNLDKDLKQIKPISEVCEMDRYKIYSVCKSEEIKESGQINEVQNKPFNSPLDFSNLSVTSYFMEERIIYGTPNTHSAWDFGASAETSVYSTCDGEITDVSFKYSTNTIDTNGGAGNYIKLKCIVDDIEYIVLYGHLYPNSSKVKIGDKVSSWQQIAGVGITGYSTGNHLHYQVSKNGKVIDGLSLVDFNKENEISKIHPTLPSTYPTLGSENEPRNSFN